MNQTKDFPVHAWILEVRPTWTSGIFKQIACIRGMNATFDTSANIVSVITDTAGCRETIYNSPIGSIVTELVSVLNADTLQELFDGTRVDIAGSATLITGEVIQAGAVVIPKGTVYVITNKNGDNTIVTSVVIDDNGSPLVLDTNYTLKVDTDGTITGEIGKSYITFLTDTSGVGTGIDIDYSFTPLASSELEYNLDTVKNKEFEVRVRALDNDWVEQFRIDLDKAILESDGNIQVQDLVNAWSITWMTLTFRWLRGTKMKLTDFNV